MVAAAFSGILGGFLSSSPIGPINLHVLQLRLHLRKLFSFIAGVVLADAIFCLCNPGFLSFWVLWSSSLSPLLTVPQATTQIFLFALVALLGDLVWFSTLFMIGGLAEGTPILGFIRKITGGLLGIIGCFLFIKGCYGLFVSL